VTGIFEASPRVFLELMIGGGSCGFYIPAYQRAFSWNNANLDRLIEDMLEGLDSLIADDESYTFLGTIIAINDTTFQTVSPRVVNQLPDKVLVLVDGQQRLTSLAILTAVLNDQVRAFIKKPTVRNLPDNSWLKQIAMTCETRLLKAIQIDMSYGEYQYYPKVIRALDDQWSREEQTKNYASPIARSLFEYCYARHADRSVDTSSIATNHEEEVLVSKAFSRLRKHVRETVVRGIQNDEFASLPLLGDILESKILQEAIFNAQVISQEDKDFLKAEEEDSDISKLFRLVVFSEFLLSRVALTLVTTQNENYAFSIFEALNSTGTPLTAFETFKPKVIETIGLQHYEDSAEYEIIKNIEENIGDAKREAITADLLVTFLLGETGEKQAKKLDIQRKKIRAAYDKATNPTNDRVGNAFLTYLMDTSSLMRSAWWKKGDASVNGLVGTDGDQARLALLFMQDARHQIALSPLSRFYSEALARGHHSDFIEACKACAAFFCLWRAAHESTSGIDAEYRKLMSDGLPNERSGLGEEIAPFARSLSTDTLAAADLKTAFRWLLSNAGYGTKELWVSRLGNRPIFAARNVAKLLLLAAAHNALPDTTQPGLIKKAALTEDNRNMLTPSRWLTDDYSTVEHIAPQTFSNHWSTNIYENPDSISLIGNLTLLPSGLNSSAGNSAWERKKKLYRLFVTQDDQEAANLISQLQQSNNKSRIEEIRMHASYLTMLESLASFDDIWNLEMIKLRTKNLASLAWDELSTWLGY